MDLFQKLRNAYAANQHAVRIPDGPGGPPVRRRFRFSGLVQGVGFRYEARLLAGQLELTGWVRNLPDGAVAVEAEGPRERVAEFLRAMGEVPRFDITDVEIEDLPLLGTETAFRVLY